MTRNLRYNLVVMAVEALKTFAGPDISRETATALLPHWRWLVPLSGEEDGLHAEILWHFTAEPAPVAGVDYLPSPPVVEHYATAAYSGGMIDPWVDCSCGETFNASTSALTYAALDKHVADEKAQQPAAGDPKVYLPLVAERFQGGGL